MALLCGEREFQAIENREAVACRLEHLLEEGEKIRGGTNR
jgi:hypothetical protein